MTAQQRLLNVLCSGLAIGIPFTVLFASEASAFPINPCPQIYYEEPFNSTRAVPSGCPPNQATQELIDRGTVAPNPVNPQTPPQSQQPVNPQTDVLQPPLPEDLSAPIATVVPMNGAVNVQMRNNTNARITYQAVGHTENRILGGGESVLLRNLPTPITITLVREDGGLIRAIPVSGGDPNQLSVTLDAALSLETSDRALRIQMDGQVFAN